ncbi:MAG: PD-(D/E)XK nuclease family protein [Verrucomicrobiales bacterium]|nr:PD-(D/E)XK nuclease family protein [Verrucomicrobiales bacterium]
MIARFLLGPAGSGKTFRCVAEVRAALQAEPDGAPLLFLAPKQATFQLERYLLADPSLPGYTRLRILSFDRLAAFLLESLGVTPPPLLAEEGRLMVLRALLTRHRHELSAFRATARLAGFASQLNLTLRELQRHQVRPERLTALARRLEPDRALSGKLADLALLLDRYLQWLKTRLLDDADGLLDLATFALRSASRPALDGLRFGGLWLDGFAEMTPQELDLLATLLPACEQATLAFCLDAEPVRPTHWLSAWTTVGESHRRLRERLEGLPACHVEVEVLERCPPRSRFVTSPVLEHLERHWSAPQPASPDGAALRVVSCANPTQEATVAAQLIHQFVREQGGRYREATVLVRSLESYHATIRRVFRRHRIPLFLDRRESVAHHPLAELTRNALRTVAFGWQTEDWFGALKTGLCPADPLLLDRFENEALAHGWSGRRWLTPLSIPDRPALGERLERLRQSLIPPFLALRDQLRGVGDRKTGPENHPPAAEGADARRGSASWEAPLPLQPDPGTMKPSGASEATPCAGETPAPPGSEEAVSDPPLTPTGYQLAAALRAFWHALDVPRTLNRWAEAAAPARGCPSASVAAQVHAEVWDQMSAWLENLALGFPDTALSLRDWLPILEAGLGRMTVGVIPPALDQVVVGAVDRTRSPDLKLSIVLGLNDGVFPGQVEPTRLLTEADCARLAALGVELGPDRYRQISRERYYGYIACTRSREQLVATFARRDAQDRPLNPSPFVAHLRRLFPTLTIETAPSLGSPATSCGAGSQLCGAGSQPCGAGFQPAPAAGPSLPIQEASLHPVVAAPLYGPARLRTSVSRLEDFAACPFKFFVQVGLRAEERRRFEVDARQRGSFQHEVLRRFHESVRHEDREWRDLTPDEGRARVRRVAEAVAREFGGGLLKAEAGTALTARGLTDALAEFVAVLIGWLRTSCRFNPVAAELEIGTRAASLPAWEIPLDQDRCLALVGKLDRVDLAPGPGPDEFWCVVHDYKSGSRQFDPLLFAHGIQLQLPAYLAAVCRVSDSQGARAEGQASPDEGDAAGKGFPTAGIRLLPAGMFYVNLRGDYEGGKHRGEVLGETGASPKAYQHRGRFNAACLDLLDDRPSGNPSGQFAYRLKQNGEPAAVPRDPVPEREFRALVGNVEGTLRALGNALFAGRASVDPYQKGQSTACDLCRLQAICRIDPWTHPYRRLRPVTDPPRP